MTWIKIEDTFPENPKILEAGKEAAWLYLTGLCYCGRNLSDGVIPKAAARRLSDGDVDSAAAKLIELGLWIDKGTTYLVHDYLQHQQSRKQVDGVREKARERQSRKRHGVTSCEVRLPDTDTDTDTSSTPTEMDTAKVRARVVELCDLASVDGDLEQTLRGYRTVIDRSIPMAIQKYGHVNGIGQPSLENVAIEHAARTFLSTELTTGQLRRLQALRRDHGAIPLLEALPNAAANAERDPISYTKTILASKETS